MDFKLADDVESFRAEVRAFLHEHLPPEVIERTHRTGTIHDWNFYRALGDKGWVAASWPVEYGGGGKDPWESRVFAEECARHDAPTDGMAMTLMIANTVRHVGTEEQKQSIIPRVLRGEIIIALGYSEPEAGSDVANSQTTAVRDGDDWIINGEKVFTSMAHEAAYVFLLTRTNPDVPKHKGLTMFLLPTDQPGFEVKALPTLGAPGRTNRTYYRDMRVHDRWRVGDVDGGWAVMNVALTFERGGMFPALRALDATEQWARATGAIDDREVRARLARMAMEHEVSNLLNLKTTWIHATGGMPGVEGSMSKLFTAETVQRSTADLMDLLGPAGLLHETETNAPTAGQVEYAWRKAAVASIYGGSSEIMREIIAQRHLGLPKTRGK